MLLSVQAVGPKVALAVLSAGPPRDLVAALAAGDAARFQAVPGIGKRTAERIIVELREKVGVDGRRRAGARADRRPPRRAADNRASSPAKACSSWATRPPRRRSCCASAEGESAEELIGAGAAPGEGAAMSRCTRRGSPPMTETAARIQTPYLVAEDELDRSLRPRRLEEFVGQETLREQLAVAIEACGARGEALDHLLLAGPPGLGKTSLAQIVAAELEVPFVQTAGPALERKGDVAAFLTALEPRSVFFVDEIHRLPRALEETFYPAMEDQRLPITVGQGAGARVVTLELPPFTLVGATTRTGLLTTPLRDRFGIQARLEPYAVQELAIIVRRSAGILEIELEEDGAIAIAARSRGTPRVANRLLKRVRDFAEVRMAGRRDRAGGAARRWRCSRSTSAASTASTARS